MAYATYAYAVSLYGASKVAIHCDRDLDGNVDTDAFDAHLELASATVNSYLLGRYTIPLAEPSAMIKKCVVDLALYNASPEADVLTVEVKDRYEQAMRYLRDLAANRAKLETSADETSINNSHAAITTTRATQTFTTDTRVFQTQTTRRLV